MEQEEKNEFTLNIELKAKITDPNVKYIVAWVCMWDVLTKWIFALARDNWLK